MNEQRQDDQLEPTYGSYVAIRDVVLKTCWKQWTKEKDGEKGPGISVLMAWHDDEYIYIYIYIINIYVSYTYILYIHISLIHLYIHGYHYLTWWVCGRLGQMSRVFTNGPCLTLSIIRYGSRVKWSNSGNGVAPFPTLWCCSYWKGSLLVPLDYNRQLIYIYISMIYIINIYIYIYIYMHKRVWN